MTIEEPIAAPERRSGPTASSSPARLRCEVATSFGRIANLQSVWDDAVLRLNGPIYMTFDWLQTWWSFYGEGRELRLLAFWAREQLVALLPLYLDTVDFGLGRIRIARLVGANLPPKTFNPPVAEAWASQVFEQTFQRVFAVEKCDLFSLGPVSKEWSGSRGFQDACERRSDLAGSCDYSPSDVQTLFRLPASFDEYLQRISPGERKSRLKRLRQLQKNHRVTTDVIADPARVEEEFVSFLHQHASQWQAIGKGGHFEAWPGAEAYNRELVRAQARHGRVRFFRMLVDGEVVANRYTFLLGDRLFSELPARAVGARWDKLGIGVCSMIKFNEDAIGAGIATIDSGLGGYDHKANLGGDEIPVGTWSVVRNHPTSRLRARFFKPVAQAVKILFHKVWYRRVVPCLPGGIGRTQSLWWLRFDV